MGYTVSHNIRAKTGQGADPTGDSDPLDIPDFLKVENRPANAEQRPPTAVVEEAEERVCRPLHELVRLIQDDLARGEKAARQAGLPHYRAAGQKMLEAKAQLRHGEFEPWLRRNFKISARQCRTYMRLAETQNGSALPFADRK